MWFVSEQSGSEYSDGLGMWKKWMSTVWQIGVDGGSKWMAGTRQTEVRLDGWCEDGLGQQKNDGGGSATLSERQERVESPLHM